jgi:Ca-activated chloride channel family protein
VALAMSSWLAEFHFLRPEWLWLLFPSAVVIWLLGRREDPLRPFEGRVASHLLPHLLVGQARGFRVRPVQLLAASLLVGTLALAGPAWQREAPPFARERAALVVALDLSRGMDASDVAPTRLERAKQKVRDLLALRDGARTALVAYAGSAHVVLPLTEDAKVLETYLVALETRLMPEAGKNTPAALALAESLLAKETVPGTILFVTDGVAKAEVGAFVAHAGRSPHQPMVLGVGTSHAGLDREGLLALARESGALVATATLDGRDVARIQRGIESHREISLRQDEGERYRDFGWYATPILALLGGLGFRRGWTMRWASVLALWAFCPGGAQASDWRFADLWATRDQQGRYYFQRGDYAAAAERFEDPLWKGAACYRAGDFACAAAAFSRGDSPEAWYGLGNAYARLGELKLAVDAYDQALAGRPEWADAKANRELLATLVPGEPKRQGEAGGAGPSQEPDEPTLDDKGRHGNRAGLDVPLLDDEQIAQMWLRGVPTSPAEFLRLKFAQQAEDQRSRNKPSSTARTDGSR